MSLENVMNYFKEKANDKWTLIKLFCLTHGTIMLFLSVLQLFVHENNGPLSL